jgi:hypothetical protein
LLQQRTLGCLFKLLLFVGLLSGCNHLFYFPDADERLTPKKLKLDYEDFVVTTKDHVPIHGWHIKTKAKNPHGTVVHFHGNAENMTTHVLYVAWLANFGFDVVTFDYRGYGRSGGMPQRDGLIEDGVAVMQWTRSHARTQDLFVIGQSLGGAVAVPVIAQAKIVGLRAVILDSTFASYRGVARQVLGSMWLTWPLQWPLSFLVSDSWSPVDSIADVHLPFVFIHGPTDPVVPYRAGRELYDAALQPKEFWTVPWDGHTSAFAVEDGRFRQHLVEYLCSRRTSQALSCP